MRSTNVPNFIKMQNTWCNFWKKIDHLAWNDRCRVFWVFEQLSSAISRGVMQLLGHSSGAVLGWNTSSGVIIAFWLQLADHSKRKSTKGCKDANFYLDYFERENKEIFPWIFPQNPMTSSKKTLESTHSWYHPKKVLTQTCLDFFKLKIGNFLLFRGVEQLFSSIR